MGSSANFPQSVPVKEFLKWSIFGEDMDKSMVACFFLTHSVVSSKVSFMGILAGFAGEGASNESGVLKNGDFRFFRSLYLPNLHV